MCIFVVTSSVLGVSHFPRWFFVFRYLAICHPLYSYTMSGLRRASKIIAVVWALALAGAIPYAVFTSVHYVHHPHTNQVSQSIVVTKLLKKVSYEHTVQSSSQDSEAQLG